MVRIKNRYILFEVLSPQLVDDPASASFALRTPVDLNPRAITHLVRDSVEDNFGDYGVGRVASSIAVKYFSPATCTGIIRVGRDHFRLVWAALSYISAANDRPVTFRVIRVSGTIKKCQQAAIARSKLAVRSASTSALAMFESDSDPMD